MVAVINESTRRKFFGDAARAVGRTIEVDGQRFQVMGVVRDVPILRLVPFADIWVPYTTDRSDNYRQEIVGDMMGLFLARSTRGPARPSAAKCGRACSACRRTIRRSSRRSTAHAETLFDTAARVVDDRRQRGGREPRTAPRGSRSPTLALLFMLLPAVNLVNLNVSRIMERASEIGVRKSFGASSRVLVGPVPRREHRAHADRRRHRLRARGVAAAGS